MKTELLISGKHRLKEIIYKEQGESGTSTLMDSFQIVLNAFGDCFPKMEFYGHQITRIKKVDEKNQAVRDGMKNDRP